MDMTANRTDHGTIHNTSLHVQTVILVPTRWIRTRANGPRSHPMDSSIVLTLHLKVEMGFDQLEVSSEGYHYLVF